MVKLRFSIADSAYGDGEAEALLLRTARRGKFRDRRNLANRPSILIIELQLPSFFDSFDPRAAAANFPSSVQAYLAGLTFALAASPCSTPVLATLLGYVASTKSLLSFRKFSAWINPTSGALLFGGGLYTLLDRLFPASSMSM